MKNHFFLIILFGLRIGPVPIKICMHFEVSCNDIIILKIKNLKFFIGSGFYTESDFLSFLVLLFVYMIF